MAGNSPGHQPVPPKSILASISNRLTGLWGARKDEEETEELVTEGVDPATDELDCPPPKRQRTIERITPRKSDNLSSSSSRSRSQLSLNSRQLDKSSDERRSRACYAFDDNETTLPYSAPNGGGANMPCQLITGFRPRNTLNREPYSMGGTKSTRQPGPSKNKANKRSFGMLDMELVSGSNVPDKAFDLQRASAEDRQYKRPKIPRDLGPPGATQLAGDLDEDLMVLGENTGRSSLYFNNPRKPSDTPSSISHGSGKGVRKPNSFSGVMEYRKMEEMIAPKKSRSPLNRAPSHGHNFSQIDGNGYSQNVGTTRTSSTEKPEEGKISIDLSKEDNFQCAVNPPYKGTAHLRPPRDIDGRIKSGKLTSSIRSPSSATASGHFPTKEAREKLAGSTREQLGELKVNRGGQKLQPSNLRDTFHRTDESPDELQAEGSTDNQAQQLQTLHIPQHTDLPSSPSNIGSSQFYSSSRDVVAGTKPKIPPKVRKSKGSYQNIRLKQFRTGNSELHQSHDYYLVFDPESSQYIVHRGEENYAAKDKYFKIEPQKLLTIIHGRDESCKIHLIASKSNERIDNRFDLELFSNKDVVDLANALQTLATKCKVSNKSSNQMDKLFEQRAADRLVTKSRNSSKPLSSTPVGESELAKLTGQKAQRQTQNTVQRPSKISDYVSHSSPDPLESVSEVLPQANSVGHTQAVGEDCSRRTRTRASTGKNSRVCQTSSSEPEEIPDERRYSRRVGLGKPWTKPLVYPDKGPKRATVEFHDLERLDEGEFLNDNLVSFYLRYLEYQLEQSNPEIAKKIYFFNTYFYASLSKAPRGKRINYEMVQRWTSKVDLFTYDYVVVPINENAHWYLAIICNLRQIPRVFHNDGASSPLGITAFDGASEEPEPPTEHLAAAKSPQNETLESDASVELAEEQVSRMSLSQDKPERPSLSDGTDDQVTNDCASSENTDIDGASEPKFVHDHDQQSALTSSSKTAAQDSTPPRSTNDPIRNVVPQKQQNIHTSSSKKKKQSVDPSQPRIVTLDSLALSHPATARNLKEYLVLEGKAKRNLDLTVKEIPAMTAKEIPLQENFCDCGLFLLGYVAKFLHEPREFVTKVLRQKYDVSKDWPEMDASEMRNEIRNLIIGLQGENRMTTKSISGVEPQATGSSKAAETPNMVDSAKGVAVNSKSPKEDRIKERKPKKGTLELSGKSTRADALEGASRIDQPVIPPANLAVPKRPTDGQASLRDDSESKATMKDPMDDTPIVTKERIAKNKKHRSMEPEKQAEAPTTNVDDYLPAEVPASPCYSSSRERPRIQRTPKRSPRINESDWQHSPHFEISDGDESQADPSKLAVVVESPERPPARGKL